MRRQYFQGMTIISRSEKTPKQYFRKESAHGNQECYFAILCHFVSFKVPGKPGAKSKLKVIIMNDLSL